MNVLITGGSGLVGSALSQFLPSKMDDHNFLFPSSKVLNLLHKCEVKQYLNDNKIDFFIHAAGKVGGIQANIEDPLSFYLDNLYMGLNLLEGAFAVGVKRGINLGSSCIYPHNFERPIKEEDLLKGELEPTNEGYALAKLGVIKLAQFIHQADNTVEYKTIIPCNLYGPGDSFDPENSHLIPAIIKKIHDAVRNEETSVEIWGDGTARREFMYSEDLAKFIYTAILKFDDLPFLINIGLGSDYTINEFYQTVAKVLDYKGSFDHDLSRPTGMKRKLVDTSKMDNLNWITKTSLEEGILKTYKSYTNTLVQ